MTKVVSKYFLAKLTHHVGASFSLFLVIIAFTPALAQQAGRTIARIEVKGLQRLSADEVIATTELKAGTPFSVADVDAAGQRLIDSGLFTNVGYRTQTNGKHVTIIFQVEEARGGQSPVVYDNLVWFTDDELNAAIRREVQAFNGLAPDSGNMTDAIKAALQNLLNEKQIKGTIEYAPWQLGLNSTRQEHLFSVSGVPIPICSLHFPGAKNVAEEKLIKSSKQLTDADYSQKSAVALGSFILFPIYRELGQLRARFSQPIAKFEDSANCKAGVNLTIPVEEGAIYRWEKADWVGNQALPPADLDAALGMKKGEVANGLKFDKGLLEVKKAYGRTGHLEVGVRPQAEFDDPASLVTYKIDVKEGPQYRMGNLFIKGLSEGDAKLLEQKWQLRSGGVLDTSYIDQFLKRDARDVMQKLFFARQEEGKQPPRMTSETKPNRQTLTADIILEFKE